MPQTRTPIRTRANQYGFFPASGTDYTSGQEPEIARRLAALGRVLKLHLIGISGARTPAHSVEVGGFANDPHTRGQASDTPGIESVPENVLRRFGLTRPFPGAREADHIQLLGGARGSTSGGRPGKTFNIADLWGQQGGPRNLAPIMAAIALAESGGRVDAVGGPNSDGSYDYGLFQINSVHSQFDKHRLVSDAAYNTRAAISVWRSQGLAAWSTYNSGAYQSFMGSGRTATTNAPRSRPGGDPSSSSGSADTIFANYIGETDGTQTENVGFSLPGIPGIPGIPSIPNPLDLFKDAAGVVNDTKDFLKWIAWIFHPRNVLRVVEFFTGLTLIILGIHTAIQVHRDGETVFSAGKKAAGNAAAATPVGRAARVAKGARAGRQAATATKRRKEFEGAYKRGKSGVDKRRKATDKRFGKDAPF